MHNRLSSESNFVLSSPPWFETRARRIAAFLAFFFVALLPGLLWGQAPNVFPSSGNVGIGTTTPAYPLEVVNPSGEAVHTIVGYLGGSAGGGVLALRSAQGSFSAPGSSLSGDLIGHVAYQGYMNGGFYPGARIRGWASQNWTSTATGTYLTFETTTNGTTTLLERMRIDQSGNVGIGVTAPVHPLQVNGTIGATQVIVSSTGADYVFRPSYKLAPLKEVAAYIEKNHHLPEIPSAAEVQQKGVNLGDMQAKLLAKIEELTLHMIQEDERNNRLEKQNRELKHRIERLETSGASGGTEARGRNGDR
jgi:hypothetical protein